jgi:hypothetical protein
MCLTQRGIHYMGALSPQGPSLMNGGSPLHSSSGVRKNAQT